MHTCSQESLWSPSTAFRYLAWLRYGKYDHAKYGAILQSSLAPCPTHAKLQSGPPRRLQGASVPAEESCQKRQRADRGQRRSILHLPPRICTTLGPPKMAFRVLSL